MTGNAPQLRPGPPALLLFLARFFLLSGLLAAALALFPCAQAQAAGALPWLAPGQQSNGTAQDANATTPVQTTAPVAPAPAAPGQAVATAPEQPAAAPVDAAGLAQFDVLRQYFRGQVTLDETYLQVYSRRVKDGETMALMTLREMVRSRGNLDLFRTAEVDLSELVFTRITADPDLARIRVTGRYRFIPGPKALSTVEPRAQEILEVDALFRLLPEMGEWKIWERKDGWQP